MLQCNANEAILRSEKTDWGEGMDAVPGAR